MNDQWNPGGQPEEEKPLMPDFSGREDPFGKEEGQTGLPLNRQDTPPRYEPTRVSNSFNPQAGQPIWTPPQSVYPTPGYYPAPGIRPIFAPSPEMEERRRLRRDSHPLGACLLALMLLMFFWMIIVYFVAGTLGFSSLQVDNLINDPAVSQVHQIILSSFLFIVPFVIIMKIFGVRISDIIPLSRPEKGLFWPFVLMGTAVCAFSNIAVSQAGYIFEMFGFHYEVNYGEDPAGIFGFLLSFLATAVVPPLVEEFAMRGVVMGHLRKYGDGFALIVSSALFGLMHGNFEQIPFAFLLGLILGYSVLKTNSLWTACAIHFFTNFISVFFTYALGSLSDATQNLIYVLLLAFMLLGGMIGILLLKNRKDVFTLPKAKTVGREKQKLGWFFSSPTIIIFSIICLLVSCVYFL